MKKHSYLFTDKKIRAVALATLLATLTFASVQAVAAKASAEDRVEVRITELRTQIKITPAQEGQWNKVTQVMRDNAKAQDALTQSRLEKAKTLTAVEDLKSYGEIVAAHADGIQKLIPVFEVLYDSMSDAQKKEADEAFRHGHRHHHGKHSNH
jgi:periplasmic protein CpxP/Spy